MIILWKFRYLAIVVLVLFLNTYNVKAQTETNYVGQQTFSFEDKARNRKLVTEIWFPTHVQPQKNEGSPFIRIPTARNAAIITGRFPLIVFSHGTGGGRLTVEWFCAGLAAHGFIVAAVDHFGNTFDNPIPIEFAEFWKRPQDITFIIDQLLANPDIYSSIDQTRIGAAGFSLGGFTAIALSGAVMDYPAFEKFLQTPDGKKETDIPEMPGLISYFKMPEVRESFLNAPPLKDKRIKSVFVMSPALGQIFPVKENFKDVNVPVSIVSVGKDQLAPPGTNALHYAKMIGGAKYTELSPAAGHYVFLNEAMEPVRKEAPHLFTDAQGVDRKDIHNKGLSLAVTHFSQTLK
jgi:predicted dienelactone hydrolase